MKNKSDDALHAMAASGLFRVNAEGRIETCRRWNGHRDVEVDWYVCDRDDGKGYRYVSYRMARVKAHRLAYLLYHPGEDIRGLEINHDDGDRKHNLEGNLEKCGPQRQSQHAYDTGLNPARGARHPRAKLDDEKVRVVRERRKMGVPYTRLAAEFGVTPAAVRFACIRHTWKHVEE